jgi:Ni,Fe-hydrogenase III component G
MNPQNFIERIEALCQAKGLPVARARPEIVDIHVSDIQLVDTVSAILAAGECYLIAITGLDPGLDTGELWTIYHLGYRDVVINLRVSLPREKPELPTLIDIIPAARIFEQELSEVLGVNVIDTISGNELYQDHLFLSDDWPEGVYPLRKDFQGVIALN